MKEATFDLGVYDGVLKKGEYIKARRREGRQKQLDAHPRIPYPKYTFKDNIDDYGGKLYEELFRPLLLAVFGFGIPTYLITWLFNHFDIEGWNVYVWCIYGAICLYVLYRGIMDFLRYKASCANERNEDYYDRIHLSKYLYKKGITKQAEKIMKDAYNEARANKGKYEAARLYELIERAYQDALEYVMCYFDDEERWSYLEANENYRRGKEWFDLRTYAFLYYQFYLFGFNKKDYMAAHITELFDYFEINYTPFI